MAIYSIRNLIVYDYRTILLKSYVITLQIAHNIYYQSSTILFCGFVMLYLELSQLQRNSSIPVDIFILCSIEVVHI